MHARHQGGSGSDGIAALLQRWCEDSLWEMRAARDPSVMQWNLSLLLAMSRLSACSLHVQPACNQ